MVLKHCTITYLHVVNVGLVLQYLGLLVEESKHLEKNIVTNRKKI